MFKLLSLLFFIPALVMAQAQPSSDPSRLRYAVYEVVKVQAQRQGIPANDPRIPATAQAIGSRFSDAANNPQYQQTAVRWAWILFRLSNGASPYLSLALEFCQAVNCVQSPKTEILSVPKPNQIITRYQYDLNTPTPVPGQVYFAGRMIPKTDFSCGGSDGFIENAEFYFPGDGTPCRVRMGIPSALRAFEKYLNNTYDYFGIEPGDLVPWYAENPLPSLSQLPMDRNLICYAFSNIPPSQAGSMLAENPFFPCLDKPPTYDPYPYAEGQPPTFEPFASATGNGARTRFVTDFDFRNLPSYPRALPRGVIDVSPWTDGLSDADKSPLLNPRIVRRLIEMTWPQAALSPGYTGLPWPPGGIPDSVIDPLPYLDFWPRIGDLIEPMPEPNWLPQPRPNTNPQKPVKVFIFNWNCGFSNFPSCLFSIPTTPLKPDVDLIPVSADPFDPISIQEFEPKNFFLKYLNNRFTGSSCAPHSVSASVLGKPLSIDWDFCPFATVARDVLSLLAYIITAGSIFGSISSIRVHK